MRVLVKEPYKHFEFVNINTKEDGRLNDFNQIKTMIGCNYIELVSIKGFYNLCMFVDEEGALNGSTLNVRMGFGGFPQSIFGTIVLAKTTTKDSEMYLHDITDEDVKDFLDMIL